MYRRRFERVRKVDTNGIITTVAGSSTGAPGYSGDGVSVTPGCSRSFIR